MVVFGVRGSIIYSLFNYISYYEKQQKLTTLTTEVTERYEQLNDIAETILKLELEAKEINKEKEKQIEEYQKWVRQNQILEDLLK